MRTAELIVQLPEDEVEFLEAYAKEHDMTVAELLRRQVRRLQSASEIEPHPANLQFAGTVPGNVDAREEYREHIENKHR